MSSLNTVMGMLLLFSKIWLPLCSQFIHCGYLLFKFTLVSGGCAHAEVQYEQNRKISACGEDICEELSENLQN